MTQGKKEDATMMVGCDTHTVGEVEDGMLDVPKARLICLDDSLLDPKQKGLEIILNSGIHTVGRKSDNTDPIFYQGISGKHARIYPSKGQWVIEDLGSTNGIWIKGIREKQAILVPGDFVKIGSIPFQYVLEDPTQILPLGTTIDIDDAGGGTMYLANDEKKADRIVELLTEPHDGEKVEKHPHEKATHAGMPVRDIPAGKKAAQRKSSITIFGLISLIVVIAVGGYWVFTLLGGPGGNDAFLQHEKSMQKVMDTFEVVKGEPSTEELEKQSLEVEKLIQAVSADASKYPNNQSLKELLARLRFLHLERQLLLFAKGGKVQQAEPAIASLLTMVATDPAQSGEQPGWTGDMRSLLDLAKDVVAAKMFRQKYPQPAKEASVRPSRGDMASLMEVSRRIDEKKKDNNIKMLLSLRFPLFGRLVAEVDSDDLPTVMHWKDFL